MSYSLKPGVVTGQDYLTLLKAAKEGGYALPAVNAVGTNSVNAVLESSAKNNSDVNLNFRKRIFLRNKPLTIYGNGSQTRSFCYVSDMIEGLICAMNSNYSSPINLGNPEEITIKKVNGIVYINEAEVVTADIEASNGVIHFINRVLQPLN